jgi:hypothetical protein
VTLTTSEKLVLDIHFAAGSETPTKSTLIDLTAFGTELCDFSDFKLARLRNSKSNIRSPSCFCRTSPKSDFQT